MAESMDISHSDLQESKSVQIPDSQGQESNYEHNTRSDRDYEFFVTTNEPRQPEGRQRDLIRRLVMRNFIDTKGAGPPDSSLEHDSANTVMAEKELKSRFRLSQVGKDKSKAVRKKRSGHEQLADVRKKRPNARRTLSGVTDSSERSQCATSLESSPGRLSIDEEERAVGKLDGKILLRSNPSIHLCDPFDVLPVPGTPQLDMLFKLYKSGVKKNSIAINPKSTWWSFISNDAGLLHATLATWALYGVLVRGINGLRVDKLRHKNEAIKEINLKIGSSGGNITDELVGTVVTMASFENLLGAYDAAQLHIAALKRMIKVRGGLFALGHNDGLIRGIIWVDFHTAAAFHMPPSFPQIKLDPDAPPLPDKLLEEAACTSPTSLLQLSLAAVDCFNIFYRLHRLALSASSYWLEQVDRLTLSNLLYETEYIILSVPDYSRNFLEFDIQSKGEDDEDDQTRASAAHSSSVIEALLAACHIFIYAALREVPTNAKIFTILLERLRIAVARPSMCTIQVWKKEQNINMLLWSLVVACSVITPGAGRSWWIGQVVDAMIELEIRSLLDLEMALHRVAWVDTYFNSVLRDIWHEISQHI